jgi:hypothetical protein
MFENLCMYNVDVSRVVGIDRNAICPASFVAAFKKCDRRASSYLKNKTSRRANEQTEYPQDITRLV